MLTKTTASFYADDGSGGGAWGVADRLTWGAREGVVNAGVTDLLLLSLLLLSSDKSLSSLLLFALLALGCSLFRGEANLFLRLTCGSFFTSPSGKCLELTREYNLISLSSSWKTHSQVLLLSGSLGKRWKEALWSLERLLPHTSHVSPGITQLYSTRKSSIAPLSASLWLYFSIEFLL